MGDGDIFGALFKTVLGIAAGEQKGVDEFVCFNDGGLGVVDKAGLETRPLFKESLAFGGAEFADIEGFDTVFASGQF